MTASLPRSSFRKLRPMLGAVLVCLLGYASLVGIMLANQEALLFYPAKLDQDFAFDKPGVVERWIEAPGARLSALHFKQPDAKGLIFFLHGNAGNLDIWLPSVDFYRRVGFDLFMIDYRGFGKSSGRIESEAQLHADVLAAWNSVAPEYAGKPIVIYGRSLGTGLATKLATEVDAALLVLVSPFTSFVKLADELYPWAPTRFTRYTMRSEDWLAQASEPVFIVHGGKDDLVRLSHAQALKARRPDAELVVLPDAGHYDVQDYPAYFEALAARLAGLDVPRTGLIPAVGG